MLILNNISEIDQPTIELLIPVTDTEVLVAWSHEHSLSDDLSYVVFDGAGNNQSVPYPASHTLLRGLLPLHEYQVSVQAHLEFNGTLHKSRFDTNPVVLPRQGMC